jgi:hypothetical protein
MTLDTSNSVFSEYESLASGGPFATNPLKRCALVCLPKSLFKSDPGL